MEKLVMLFLRYTIFFDVFHQEVRRNIERGNARFVFSKRIRERTRRHRKSTDDPNDFSHKPKTTLRVRGYLLGFRRALGRPSRAPVGKKVPTT